MSREFCEACNMIRNGVKSRIALEHTCGLEPGAIPENHTYKQTGDSYFLDMKMKKILKRSKDGNIDDITQPD